MGNAWDTGLSTKQTVSKQNFTLKLSLRIPFNAAFVLVKWMIELLLMAIGFLGNSVIMTADSA
jgi:hypothetical protein